METAIEKLLKDSKKFNENVLGGCSTLALAHITNPYFVSPSILHYTDILKWSSRDAALLVSGAKFAEHFGSIFHPLVGEYDLIGKHPNAEKTIRHVDQYMACMQELKETLSPELELIETRVIAPAKELQTVMKAIHKSITKREHKVRCLTSRRVRLIGWADNRLRSAQ
jgi:hypothetical protein